MPLPTPLAALAAALLLVHAPITDEGLRHLEGVSVHVEVDEVAARHGIAAGRLVEQVEAALRKADVGVRKESSHHGKEDVADLVVVVDAIDDADHGLVAFSLRFGVRQVAMLPDGSRAWVSIWSLDVLGYAAAKELAEMLGRALGDVAERFGAAYGAAHELKNPPREAPRDAGESGERDL
jgi:hypothetical protein